MNADAEKELLLEFDRMLAGLSYDFEVLTNKTVNNSFNRYIRVLNTYYDRINRIAINSEAVTKNLTDAQEALNQITKIGKNINKLTETVTNIFEQNNLLISSMITYLQKNGDGNSEIYKKIQQTIKKNNENINIEETEAKKGENFLKNSDEYVKGLVYDFNRLFYANIKELLERGYFTCSVKMWTSDWYTIESDVSTFRYLAYESEKYIFLFPTFSIIKIENKRFFEKFFDTEYFNTDLKTSKIFVLKAAVFVKKTDKEGYNCIEKGFVKII